MRNLWYSPNSHGFFRFFNQVEALDLLHQLHKTTLQLSVRSFSAAISACARSGQWQQSLELLNQMEGAKLAANIITYNAAISACEKCCLSPKLHMEFLTLEVYRRPQSRSQWNPDVCSSFRIMAERKHIHDGYLLIL